MFPVDLLGLRGLCIGLFLVQYLEDGNEGDE